MRDFALDISRSSKASPRRAFILGTKRLGLFGIDWDLPCRVDLSSGYDPILDSYESLVATVAREEHVEHQAGWFRAFEMLEAWLSERVYERRLDMFGRDHSKAQINAMRRSCVRKVGRNGSDGLGLVLTLRLYNLDPEAYTMWLSDGRVRDGNIAELRGGLSGIHAYFSTSVYAWHDESAYGLVLLVKSIHEVAGGW